MFGMLVGSWLCFTRGEENLAETNSHFLEILNQKLPPTKMDVLNGSMLMVVF